MSDRSREGIITPRDLVLAQREAAAWAWKMYVSGEVSEYAKRGIAQRFPLPTKRVPRVEPDPECVTAWVKLGVDRAPVGDAKCLVCTNQSGDANYGTVLCTESRARLLLDLIKTPEREVPDE